MLWLFLRSLTYPGRVRVGAVRTRATVLFQGVSCSFTGFILVLRKGQGEEAVGDDYVLLRSVILLIYTIDETKNKDTRAH